MVRKKRPVAHTPAPPLASRRPLKICHLFGEASYRHFQTPISLSLSLFLSLSLHPSRPIPTLESSSLDSVSSTTGRALEENTREDPCAHRKCKSLLMFLSSLPTKITRYSSGISSSRTLDPWSKCPLSQSFLKYSSISWTIHSDFILSICFPSAVPISLPRPL